MSGYLNLLPKPWSACLLLSLLCTASAQAQSRLRDPFERPAPALVPKNVGVGDSAAASENPWKPELRAVMFDGARSLVDIGGRIMALGDRQAGYQLIRVAERSAVLRKDGSELTLTLDKEKLP